MSTTPTVMGKGAGAAKAGHTAQSSTCNADGAPGALSRLSTANILIYLITLLSSLLSLLNRDFTFFWVNVKFQLALPPSHDHRTNEFR